MPRDLQDFLDEPPFGLIIAGALGLIVTVFAFIGFRNLRSDDQVDTSAQQSTTSVAESTLIAPASPTALIFTPASSTGVVCDGLSQPAGLISGAEPGESLLFSGASGADIPPGVADATGSYPVEWSCSADEVGTTWRIQAVGQKSGGRVDMVFTGSSASPGSGFSATSVTDPFPCDGEVRPVAVLVGAEGGEEITFSSPQSSSIRPGTADATGQLQMNWSCDPNQADTTWNVTATGTNSNQTVEIIFTGSSVASSARPSTTATTVKQTTSQITTATTATTSSTSTASTASTSATANPAQLVVQVSEDPFGCDGISRQFATIRNLAPLEVVTFEVSPADDPLRQGRADENGELLVRWECDAADVGTEWNLSATGATSGKSVSFSFAGAASGSTTGGTGSGGVTGGDSGTTPEPTVQLSVAVIENPFICDGEARPVATLSNLDPQETVTFESSDGRTFRDGRANASGDLTVNWQCDEDDDKTWNLTATGQTTGRTVDFSILGSSPAANN